MDNTRIRSTLRVILVGIILLEFIDKYIYLGIPSLEYSFFISHKKEYNVTDAYIEKSERIVLIPGKVEPLISIIKSHIVYEVDGEKYCNLIYTYPEFQQGDVIKIAYNKTDKKDVKRCLNFNLSQENKLDILIVMALISVLLVLYLINEHYIRALSKTKMIYYDSETDNIEKKNYILELCNDISFTSKGKVVLTVQVNKDFLWCLENLSQSKQVNEILLLDKDSNGRYEFENQTEKLEKVGLPLGYYVVGRIEQHFLCGSVISPRLYVFSSSLGITNTKYSNIYDYILDKLQDLSDN